MLKETTKKEQMTVNFAFKQHIKMKSDFSPNKMIILQSFIIAG